MADAAGAVGAAGPGPENKGARWTPEQEEWLVAQIKLKGVSFCANAMGRTNGAIIARLCLMAARKLAAGGGATPDEVAEDYGITAKILADHIAREAARSAARESAAAEKAAAPAPAPAAAGGSKKAARPASAAPRVRVPTTSASAAAPAKAPVVFNESQRSALELVRAGKSILLTGAAGTGKSETVRAIVAYADAAEMSHAVTATTGAAAVLIGGATVHSALRIGLATGSPAELASRAASRGGAKFLNAIRELKFLLIDEISMMSEELFTKISKYLTLLRKNSEPFGGLQLVLIGDFAQLPPVDGEFAFTSREWGRLTPSVVQLTEIFRQRDNAAFQALLQRARMGELSDEDLASLCACATTTFPPEFVPTRLYALNAMVARRNSNAYAALKASLPAQDADGAPTERIYDTQYSNARAKEWGAKVGIETSIALCVGAQVMLTWNLNTQDGLVNGTRGRVTELSPGYITMQTLRYPAVQIGYTELAPEDENGVKVRYLPLRLAYAISIHKSQGATLDCAETDLGESIFEYGQAYTALSRVRDLSSIRITEVRRGSFRVHPDVKAFYKSAAELAATPLPNEA